MNYTINHATEKEMPILIEWSRREGWNPGIHDATTFYKADPSGFFVGKLNNEIISTGSCVNYDDSFSFLGLYIVKPEFRGQGYGMSMTKHLLEHAGQRLIGLDGVLENIEIYKNIGFKYYYENKRFTSHARATPPHKALVNLTQIDFETVLQYDLQCFPAPREDFLKDLINQADACALAHVENGNLQGYAVRRKCFEGHKIGPLFAGSPAIAEALFLGLQQDIEGEPFTIDIPEINKEGIKLAEKYQMKYVFGCGRMYNGPEPQLDHNKIFGVTSFELG